MSYQSLAGKTGSAVHRFADRCSQDIVAEEILLVPGIGLLLFGILIIERAAYGDSGVIGLARHTVDVGTQGIAEFKGIPHILEMGFEYPEATFQN